MSKQLISGLVIAVGMLVFSGCATGSGNRVMKVQEVDYPEGISISIYDGEIKDDISVTDAKMTYGKNKRAVKLILNNNSKDTYNLVLTSEWTDKRGSIISTYPKPKKVRLRGNSGKRVILNAPNFKAKDVLVNVECGHNCVEKKK